MIYLASPYSSPNDATRYARFRCAEEFTALAIKQGHAVFSPIVHCHELARKHDLPKTFDFWAEYDRRILAAATTVWVLTLPGWENSRGVQQEIAWSREMDKWLIYEPPTNLKTFHHFKNELGV